MTNELTVEKLTDIKENGTQRVRSENELLSLMFNGFSRIEINKNTHDTLSLFNNDCDLDEYAKVINAERSHGYSSLTSEAQLYFHNMAALDSLVERGLVKRKILFTNEDSHENGWVDLNGELEGAEPQYLGWLARASCSSDITEKTFQYPDYMRDDEGIHYTFKLEQIEYLLIEKGYDVALKLQGHNDQEKRFTQQQELAQQSVEIANSSRKIAGIALCAAWSIAIGSIGSLLINMCN